MGHVLRVAWGAKLCLTGWSAYRACTGDNGPLVICGVSVVYFGLLVLATVCKGRGLPTPKEIDAIEDDYLCHLEKGFGNEKQD